MMLSRTNAATQAQENHSMKNHDYRIARISLVLALTAIQTLAQSTYRPYTFTTLAGGGGFNSPDVPGTAARFWIPNGVAADSAGNIYVADVFNNVIRALRVASSVK